MTKTVWIDKEVPRKLATVIATISVVIPSMLLSFSILSLRSDVLSNALDRNETLLALLSAFCLFGTIASARTVDWLMDSITSDEWDCFFHGRSHDVTKNMELADQFVFRVRIFQGGFLLLSLIYSGFCILFSNLIVIFFIGGDILNRWYVLVPTLIIAASIFYQMMTDESRYASLAVAIGVISLGWGIFVTSR